MKFKTICNKQYKLPAIGKWYKPHEYELYTCDISVPVFELNIMLTFATPKEFCRYVKDRDGYEVKNDNPKALYVWNDGNGKSQKYLLFTQNDWLASDYGTICHELHHAAHRALTDIGNNYGEGGEEVFAYLQGHLMELVVRAFIELQKYRNKKGGKKKLSPTRVKQKRV